MKILVICQYYYPEPFHIEDICEEFVKQGHLVTVITGEPNYPEGKIYEGYENHRHADEVIKGVVVHRCPIIPRKTGAVFRFLNYYSYPILAKQYIKRLIKLNEETFDIVFVFQLSPVMMAEPAIEYKKIYNVPVIMYCLDLWPESLVAGGISRESEIFKIFHKVSKRIYRQMDRILVTSRLFKVYLGDQFNIEANKLKYLPQYAEDIFSSKTEIREEYNPNKLNLTFAGNVGTVQSVKTIVEAASYLEDDGRFSFHVVGSGTELEMLKRFKDEIGATCIEFHGRYPLADMPSFYASSDGMVVTFQDNPMLGQTLPRKIQSYMAAGRPILGTVTGEARCVIEEAGCGLCCDAEDSKGLVGICIKFAEMSKEERKDMGERGRAYYEAHFSRTQFFETLERELTALIEQKPEWQ